MGQIERLFLLEKYPYKKKVYFCKLKNCMENNYEQVWNTLSYGRCAGFWTSFRYDETDGIQLSAQV